MYASGILSVAEWGRVLDAAGDRNRVLQRYHLDNAGAILVAALRYAPDVSPEPQNARKKRGLPSLPLLRDADEEGGGHVVRARVARFARADWYHEILDRFALVVRKVSERALRVGHPVFAARQWRRFVNSWFPEKNLAVAAGLGTIGRNGLLIARADIVDKRPETAPAWSSAVVLGLLMLPFDVEFESEGEIHSCSSVQQDFHRPPLKALMRCGSCTRCIDACPSKALAHADHPLFIRERCIQHYASIEGELPAFIAAAWNDQLYGCDICLEACPFFIPDPDAVCTRGNIGGSFDARAVATTDDPRLRLMFKDSALDHGWISPRALRRNAALILSRQEERPCFPSDDFSSILGI